MKEPTQASAGSARSAFEFAHEFQSSILRAINEASPDGILVVNEEGLVASHNRRFVEIWRISIDHIDKAGSDSAIGADDNPILSAVVERTKDPQAFLARVRELYDNPSMDDHCEIELKDGRTLERHSTMLRGDDNHYFGRVWFFRDITAQKHTEAALKELSRHDPLTGIPNRRYFFERANQELARVKRHWMPMSMCVMDIDHFKRINDQFGDAAGDETLKSFCTTSRRLLREMEFFARIGGEEFAVLAPNTSLDGASRLAERLRQTVADSKLSFEGMEINYAISIGVATLRPADTCVEDCLRRADAAMYRAKHNGRNQVQIEA
jgi:diguanylate cyclase (GGDEF)-like protein